MYAYAFRGVGLLATAPKTFLCNFAANFLKSWSLTGVVFRGAFAEIARRDTYYNSKTEGHDREKENTAFAKAFFYERAVAENIHEAVRSDEENTWKKSLHIAKSIAPVLAMGGIQGGKTGDATQSDVIAAAKETVPAKIAEQVKKGIDAAKEYRSQLRNQSKGVGAEEGSAFFNEAKYSPKVLRQMSKTDDLFHGFPKSVDGYATKYGQLSTLIGADGKVYQWLKKDGSYGGKIGTFEFIKDANGVINHRFFNTH